MCDEWRSFENFRDWAKANGYSENLTLDRRDNDDGYNPLNCRWVDNFAQANNKRNNRLIEYNGETKTIAEWANIFGIPYNALYCRIIERNWEVERAFKQPVRRSKKRDLSNIMDD